MEKKSKKVKKQDAAAADRGPESLSFFGPELSGNFQGTSMVDPKKYGL